MLKGLGDEHWGTVKGRSTNIEILKPLPAPELSVWAFQVSCKEDSCSGTIATVFLPIEASIIDATVAMTGIIKDECYSRASSEGSDVIEALRTPEELLHFLNWNSERSLSHHVVRIYPPTQANLQKEY